MHSIQWRDANHGPESGQIVGRRMLIAQLAEQSVRSKQVESDLFWVVLNLPHQTSRTLYLGNSELDATMVEATARGVMLHILEYALPR